MTETKKTAILLLPEKDVYNTRICTVACEKAIYNSKGSGELEQAYENIIHNQTDDGRSISKFGERLYLTHKLL